MLNSFLIQIIHLKHIAVLCKLIFWKSLVLISPNNILILSDWNKLVWWKWQTHCWRCVECNYISQSRWDKHYLLVSFIFDDFCEDIISEMHMHGRHLWLNKFMNNIKGVSNKDLTKQTFKLDFSCLNAHWLTTWACSRKTLFIKNIILSLFIFRPKPVTRNSPKPYNSQLHSPYAVPDDYYNFPVNETELQNTGKVFKRLIAKIVANLNV